MGCTENSPEEREFAMVAEAVGACEAKRWPDGNLRSKRTSVCGCNDQHLALGVGVGHSLGLEPGLLCPVQPILLIRSLCHPCPLIPKALSYPPHRAPNAFQGGQVPLNPAGKLGPDR